jgi:hypothetical protein
LRCSTFVVVVVVIVRPDLKYETRKNVTFGCKKTKTIKEFTTMRPLVLVFDLDSTLIYWEDGKRQGRYSTTLPSGSRVHLPTPDDILYYRPGIAEMIENLRYMVGNENIYVIAWTMGDDIYAKEVLASVDRVSPTSILLQINDIWGATKCRESYSIFGANKSANYILQSSAIRRWVERIGWNIESPLIVLVDDLAKENAGAISSRDQTANYDMLYTMIPLEKSTTLETDMYELFTVIVELLNIDTQLPNGLPFNVNGEQVNGYNLYDAPTPGRQWG